MNIATSCKASFSLSRCHSYLGLSSLARLTADRPGPIISSGDWGRDSFGSFASDLKCCRKIKERNPDTLDPSLKRGLPTSIDLLRQDSRLLAAMYELPVSESVTMHTIIGNGCRRLDGSRSDGVVAVTSARHPGTVSEHLVDAWHTELPMDPATVSELHRILDVHWDAQSTNAGLSE